MDLQLEGRVVMVVGADVVLFLSSPRTAAISGAIIPVDGGSTEGLY